MGKHSDILRLLTEYLWVQKEDKELEELKRIYRNGDAVMVVVGSEKDLSVLEQELERHVTASQYEKPTSPFEPPIVHGELPKELGTFRREEIYD